MVLAVPGLIIGVGIAVWVVSHLAGLDRIAIGGPMVMNGTDVFGNPQRFGIYPSRNFPLPFEVTFGADPDRHHGRCSTRAVGKNKWSLSPITWY